MALTDATILAAAPAPGKTFRKLSDGEGSPGLHLLIRVANGALRRVWRYEYKLPGRRDSTLGFGTWPATSIDEARRRATAAREKIKRGEDPAEANRDGRAAAELTFGVVGLEYLRIKYEGRAPKTRTKQEWLLRTCLARLSGKPLSTIRTRDIVAECARFEAKKKNETAHRMRAFAKRVFRFAKGRGYFTGENPAGEIC